MSTLLLNKVVYNSCDKLNMGRNQFMSMYQIGLQQKATVADPEAMVRVCGRNPSLVGKFR